jgi:glycosyltransferase involved in cell wall biosynthesis/GT2 family glycosyltransferase
MDYTKKPGQKIEKAGIVINSEKPTISIITPFYNGGATLMETANSIFNQTYPYFEWIIVDDGSKDEDSLKELAKLEKMDKRIKVYHKENGGPSVARDYGIEKSSKDTKYVYFLDCDDLIDKTMLECLYWTLETHPEASFAYTSMVNFGDREFIWEQWLTIEREMVENVISISSMVKKSDLLEVGCFGLKEKGMYEDWNLWLKLLKAGKVPIRVSDKLFWYRVNNTGEFSRAKQNHKKAMKYVNETAKQIENYVHAIQFPREGSKYDTVNELDMSLPMYKREDKRKNVLFIFPWMVVGGADIFNLELIKRLDKSKYKAIIVTTTPNINKLEQDFKDYAECVYDLSSFLDRNAYINFVDYLMKSRNIDMVVVSNSQYGYYMVPYLKGKYPTVPFIDYIHSIDIADPREGFGRCTMDVDKYLSGTYVCNNFTKNQLERDYKKSNVKTLYIGTDDERFNPEKYNKEELLDKYKLPKDKLIITMIARLSDEKRPEMFVEICKRIHEKHPDTYFVIGGDGPLKKKVEDLVDDNFRLLGMVSNSEEIYKVSDITINCSSLEGLALTSYESLAMGVPVISTDVGGQTELIDNTVGGVVHYNENADEKTYNDEINEYVKEADRVIDNLDEIKSNCRKKIQKGFSYKIMVKNFEKIIEENITKEKNTKGFPHGYIDYNFAVEALTKSYFYFVKYYVVNTFGISYEGYMPRNKRTKVSKLRVLLYKKYAKGDGDAIFNFLRGVKRTFREFFVALKFFIKAIPASIRLIYKLIFK